MLHWHNLLSNLESVLGNDISHLENTYLSRISVVYIDGLVQERRNSIANAMELRLFCINPSI